MRTRLSGATLLVSSCLLSAAQAPADQQPAPSVFRRDVDVVVLDVSVLDKARRPVRGLTSSDFTIFEDDVPQAIVAFEEVDVPEPSREGASWVRDLAPDVSTNDLSVRRVVVIVLDDAHIPMDPGAIQATKRIASDVVRRLGPADLAAVTLTWSGRKQDVTNDKQRLLAAIDSFAPHPNLTTGRAGSIVMRGPQGPPPCFYRSQYRSVAGCAVDTLINAAEALATAPPGRKTLIYVSNGIPFDFSAANDDSSAEFAASRSLFRALQRANVTVSTVDPVGLNSPNTTPYQDANRRLESLLMLAENTGGRSRSNSNTSWEVVPQILEESRSYYLIGISPSNLEAPDRFRRVRVTVNRPETEARTRSGYFPSVAASPRAGVTASDSLTDRTLGGALPGGSLKIRATAVPVFVPGRRDAAIVVTAGLRQAATGQPISRTVSTTATALDENAKPRGTATSSVRMSFPAAREGEFPFDVISTLSVAPGRYQVRVGAEMAGESGRVFVDVTVPDFTRSALSLSGLVLTVRPAIPSAAAPEVAGLLAVTPTTLREFAGHHRVSVSAHVVQGGNRTLQPVRLVASITDTANQVRASETTAIDPSQFAGRSANYSYEVPLARLTPGEYLLSLEAAAGGETSRHTARFTVMSAGR